MTGWRVWLTWLLYQLSARKLPFRVRKIRQCCSTHNIEFFSFFLSVGSYRTVVRTGTVSKQRQVWFISTHNKDWRTAKIGAEDHLPKDNVTKNELPSCSIDSETAEMNKVSSVMRFPVALFSRIKSSWPKRAPRKEYWFLNIYNLFSAHAGTTPTDCTERANILTAQYNSRTHDIIW